MNYKVEEITFTDEYICVDYMYDLTEEQEFICEECDFCEKEIGLCPNYISGNGRITWMLNNNVDSILEMKRSR